MAVFVRQPVLSIVGGGFVFKYGLRGLDTSSSVRVSSAGLLVVLAEICR